MDSLSDTSEFTSETELDEQFSSSCESIRLLSAECLSPGKFDARLAPGDADERPTAFDADELPTAGEADERPTAGEDDDRLAVGEADEDLLILFCESFTFDGASLERAAASRSAKFF